MIRFLLLFFPAYYGVPWQQMKRIISRSHVPWAEKSRPAKTYPLRWSVPPYTTTPPEHSCSRGVDS